ncbi:hypothetical protein B296_00035469, partial [Ensete ventricosum]
MAQPPARGRPTTAKAPVQGGGLLRPGPLQGAVAHKGSSLQGRPPTGATVARGHDQLWLGPLQGAATRRGSSPQASDRLRARPQ